MMDNRHDDYWQWLDHYHDLHKALDNILKNSGFIVGGNGDKKSAMAKQPLRLTP